MPGVSSRPDAPEPTGGPSPSAEPTADRREQQQAPALDITKSVDPDPMVIGAQATYTVTVTNGGDETAEDVVVTDELDQNLAFVAGSGCTALGQTVTCGGAGTTLAPGETATYTLTVAVDATLDEGTNIINRASVGASNAGTDSTQLITITDKVSDVAITKAADPVTVNPDGTITYTLTVTNNGPSEAVNVFVQDPTNGNLTTIDQGSLPAQCPPSGLTVSCNLGTLQPGETVQLTFTVTVNPDIPAGTEIPNCATVYTGTPESTTDNNVSCVTTDVDPGPSPSLSPSPTDGPSPSPSPSPTDGPSPSPSDEPPDDGDPGYGEDGDHDGGAALPVTGAGAAALGAAGLLVVGSGLLIRWSAVRRFCTDQAVDARG